MAQGPPFPHTHPARFGTIYGGSKAFLDRWTVSLAAEVQAAGVAVNTLSPQAAAATEVLVAHSNIADYLFEPLDTMAEAALALATADPRRLTGRVTYSLELLAELGRPVRDLRGVELLPDWQPADCRRASTPWQRTPVARSATVHGTCTRSPPDRPTDAGRPGSRERSTRRTPTMRQIGAAKGKARSRSTIPWTSARRASGSGGG